MSYKEVQHGKGALDQIPDARDKTFASVSPFDWDLGFDIELLLGYRAYCEDAKEFYGLYGQEGWGLMRYKEIIAEVVKHKIKPFRIPVKDQGSSSSCVGQGLTYWLSVLNFIETGEWIEISARDVYAYIYISPNGGAYLRDAMNLTVNRGIASEELVPCYTKMQTSYGEVKLPYTEQEYRQKPEETKEVKAIRTALQSRKYEGVKGFGPELIDKMAWSMLMNFGVFFAVNGENNGTWTTEYPEPPLNKEWGHALFGGKVFLESGERIISFINSWGNSVGVNGWQKLRSNYFNTYNVRSPWALTDKNNMSQNNNVKIIKDTNSSAVGLWLPALSPEALESLCLNFGIEIPKNEEGIIWEELIEGYLTLIQ